jgi:hypothetical protein
MLRISNISLCLEHVNSDLDAIYRWTVDNGLLLNGKKTHQAILMCKDQGRLPSHVPELRFNCDLLVYTNEVVNLKV